MNISQFVRTKPDALRLGQHFYNCYLYHLKWHDRMHTDAQELYNTRNTPRALELIEGIMRDYQWSELPDLVQQSTYPWYWEIKDV